MRIIGGTYKRKTLTAVKGLNTRPTSDRLRETLFNILGHGVKGSVVLDLYAGTGALGIEALSRGAQRAVFVDHHPQALSVIRKNIASCSLDSQSRVIRWDISKNLFCLNKHRPLFDLVFMDPPYGLDLICPALSHLESAGCLSKDALIICEHDAKECLSSVPKPFYISDQRRYGRTSLSFFQAQAIDV